MHLENQRYELSLVLICYFLAKTFGKFFLTPKTFPGCGLQILLCHSRVSLSLPLRVLPSCIRVHPKGFCQTLERIYLCSLFVKGKSLPLQPVTPCVSIQVRSNEQCCDLSKHVQSHVCLPAAQSTEFQHACIFQLKRWVGGKPILFLTGVVGPAVYGCASPWHCCSQ